MPQPNRRRAGPQQLPCALEQDRVDDVAVVLTQVPSISACPTACANGTRALLEDAVQIARGDAQEIQPGRHPRGTAQRDEQHALGMAIAAVGANTSLARTWLTSEKAPNGTRRKSRGSPARVRGCR